MIEINGATRQVIQSSLEEVATTTEVQNRDTFVADFIYQRIGKLLRSGDDVVVLTTILNRIMASKTNALARSFATHVLEGYAFRRNTSSDIYRALDESIREAASALLTDPVL